MVELKSAVTMVKDALDALTNNADLSQQSMLKLNLKEACDMLTRRVAEIAPGDVPPSDATMSSALQEANVLLEEVNAVLLTL